MGISYRIVDALREHHITQLMELYSAEWWTQTRTFEEVRGVLKWSDLVIGICTEADDRLVAFARVLTDRIFRAFVFDVIVAADHRRHGLGHRLIEELLSNPLVAQVEQVELYCRPELVPFYESLDFKRPDSGVVLMRRSASGKIQHRLRDSRAGKKESRRTHE